MTSPRLSRATSRPAPRAAALPARLAALRTAFLAAVARDTPGTDLPRYTAVLDALLGWAVAREDYRLLPAASSEASGVIAFGPSAGSTGPRWSLRPVRGAGPLVEVIPPAGPGQAEATERLRSCFNAHARALLGSDARPRIGFGALKNPAALAALLGLLDELHAGGAPDAPAPDAAQGE